MSSLQLIFPINIIQLIQMKNKEIKVSTKAENTVRMSHLYGRGLGEVRFFCVDTPI